MTQYLLSIYRDDKPRSEEEFQQSYEDVNALADELTAAGGLVFGGGLNHSTPTVVRSVDGKIVTTDGPFAETKEHIGGVAVLRAGGPPPPPRWGPQPPARRPRPPRA